MGDDLLKELRKSGEKLMIRFSIAGAACLESTTTHRSVEEEMKTEIDTFKKSIQGTAESLGSSIKGKFGKKARKSLKKHSELLKGF